MKKLCLIGLMIAATSAMSACAKEEAAPAAKQEKKAKPEQAADLKEMTLTGTVQKVEKRKKDGTVMMEWYILVCDDGAETHLPKGKYEEWAGKRIKLAGTGYTETRKGKAHPVVKTVTAMEQATDPAAAPAAK